MPTNGTAVQIMAGALTNRALSVRIAALRDNRRAYDKATTNALLDEAQRRLYWQDAYAKHTEAEEPQKNRGPWGVGHTGPTPF